jgi:2-dehydro-3-deoxygalactonokinase
MERYTICLDWGISSFRAYLMDGEETILDTVANNSGILQVADGAFEKVLEASVGHWLRRYPTAPVIASGMIASRQGWLEAPYVSCPAGLTEITKNLRSLEMQQGRRIWFVPGVMRRAEDKTPDVMRGEETQIFGALPDDLKLHSFILPGTHSKWALVKEGRIVWFSTYMTGELFAVLRNHSILGRLMEAGEKDDDAFLRGLECSATAGNGRVGLLNKLFSVRTLGLFDELPRAGLKFYLSGLLIGTEIAEATWHIKQKSTMRLIGDPGLSALYARALDYFGWPSELQEGNPTARSLARIAMNADLTGQ